MIWPFDARSVGSYALRLSMGQGYYLRPPRLSDARDWRHLREDSAAQLQPWEPLWSPDACSHAAFLRRYRRQVQDWQQDAGQSFFVFQIATDQLVGAVNLHHIRRGAAQMASLGYYMHMRYAGQGIMSAAVTRLAAYAFQDLGLHRLEAATLPDNLASRRVLEKSGFLLEGEAKSYLCINGQWRDHLIYARLAPSGVEAEKDCIKDARRAAISV